LEDVLQQIGTWMKGILVNGIMLQLSGLFDSVNTQVGDISTQVGTTPPPPPSPAAARSLSHLVYSRVSHTSDCRSDSHLHCLLRADSDDY